MGYLEFLRNANTLSIRFIKFSEIFWKQINHCVIFCRTKLTVCLKLGYVHDVMYMWSCCHLPFKLKKKKTSTNNKNPSISLNVDFFFNKQDDFKTFSTGSYCFRQVGILWDCMPNLLEISLFKLSGKSTKHELFL